MFNVIRPPRMAEPLIAPPAGPVEADETYFNGSRRLSNSTGKPGPSPGAKTVFGLLERNGRVIARHVPPRPPSP